MQLCSNSVKTTVLLKLGIKGCNLLLLATIVHFIFTAHQPQNSSTVFQRFVITTQYSTKKHALSISVSHNIPKIMKRSILFTTRISFINLLLWLSILITAVFTVEFQFPLKNISSFGYKVKITVLFQNDSISS